MDFYERIKDLCKKEGVSVKEMLESNGIVYSSYYSSQQAKRLPGLADLTTIAKHFGVSLDYLATGKDSQELPEDVRRVLYELNGLEESQRQFLIRSLEFQVRLFKEQAKKD